MICSKEFVLAVASLWIGAASQAAGADFYAGKRLTILVNYAAGGPADIDARVLAKHLGRHIEGKPTMIVQNMDGAGGVVGINYIGEVAPRDGSVVGQFTTGGWQYAIETKPRKVDFRTYEFVALQASTSIYYVRTDVKPGLKTAVDLGRADGLIVGGLSVDSSKDLLLRLSLDLLGLKYKYVTSYRGTNGVRLALQQGEVNITSESPPAYRGIVQPALVSKGDVIPLFYDPYWDGKVFTVPKEVADLPIVSFPELYKKIKGEAPKGELWEHYLTVIGLNGKMYRMLAFPPGAPKEAIEALRMAIPKLAKDEEYAAEAMKAFGYVPEWVAESGTAEWVRKTVETSPEMKRFFADYIARASREGSTAKP